MKEPCRELHPGSEGVFVRRANDPDDPATLPREKLASAA
jgi:hypothetical protein